MKQLRKWAVHCRSVVNWAVLTAAILLLQFPAAVRAQTGPEQPTVDHHAHIWSADASAHVTDPLLPAVKLPADLDRLLRDKEKFGGQKKDPQALADLYTKDALVMDPGGPSWLKGEQAISYINNNTVMNRLLPVAYDISGSSGYIAGYEVSIGDSPVQYLSNFHYVIRKEQDGKWRISSEVFTMGPPSVPRAATPELLVKHLDASGIKRAIVLSTAYWYGSAFSKPPENEYAKVRAENDWVSEQVARFPDRLVGFCSFNPLKGYALEELERCTKNPRFRGLKLHFGNSGVDVTNPQHADKIRAVFAAANEKRFPIVVHLWLVGKYGREHSQALLDRVLPSAPDIHIQIAHMAASGPGYHSDDAMEVFANAAEAGDPRMKNIYFDVASMVTRELPAATLELVAKRLRQVGMNRVLWATDRVGASDDRSRDWDWTAFRRLPLTEEEFRTIARNVAPHMR